MVRYKPLAHQLPQDHKHFGGSVSSLPQYCTALYMDQRGHLNTQN